MPSRAAPGDANYDHDRNVLAVWPPAQCIEEFEPVHLRHHQVENDHVGSRGRKRIDRYPAVLRLGRLPPNRLKRLAHSAADNIVIIDEKGRVPRPTVLYNYPPQANSGRIGHRMSTSGTSESVQNFA